MARLARAAGAAPSTVSLALRGSPKVRPETAARIRAMAEKLGYRADPRVSSLMAHIRQTRPLKERERLAFVWVSVSRAETASNGYLRTIHAGARRRAEELGCGLDAFWLDEDRMTPARLEKILRARGITGVVFSAAIHDLEVRLDWGWSHFAAAVIGNTEWHPQLHRAGHNHYRSMWLVMERLRREGSLRPAVLLHEPHHRRIHGVHLAAFLANHPSPREAPDMARFDTVTDAAELRPWFRAIKADALILVVNPGPDTVARIRKASAPERIVTLAWQPDSPPGIDMRDDQVAAAAVDLVVSQLHRNERGAPKHPTTLLIEGEWREDGARGSVPA